MKGFKSKLKEVITCPLFKKLFDVGKSEVYTEKEVVDRYGNTKRMDRVIVKEKEVWVADYKSSKAEDAGKDIEQIQLYKRLLKSIYPDFKVSGYLIYLDQLLLEEIHG
jgi:ATP-dependent exoDNAse (exonuclease V) beta subunit